MDKSYLQNNYHEWIIIDSYQYKFNNLEYITIYLCIVIYEYINN